MVLSNGFFYERIQLDTINERFNKVPTAKEGDANGRGMIVVLTENGLVKNTTGVSLLFKWEHTRIAGAQGLEDFEPLDLTKGEYIVTYPTEMNHEGYVKAEIRIIDNGKYAGSRNMKIQVEPSVGDDTAMESSNQFSALVTALLEVNFWNARIDAVEADFIQRANDVEETYQQELVSLNSQLAETESYYKLPVMNGQNITSVFNEAILEHNWVYVPSGTYVVSAAGLLLNGLSNKRVLCDGILTQATNDSGSSSVLTLKNCVNIIIDSPTIIGDKDTHTGTLGEQGHGINIVSSTSIKIISPKISKTWGDGIYYGVDWSDATLRKFGTCEIIHPVIDDCSRNGISICMGDVTITNPKISNINRTLPKSGIDIEPEGNAQMPILGNVIINNPQTTNCGEGGITTYLAGMTPLTQDRPVNIIINNHIDNGSKHGFLPVGNMNFSDGIFEYNNGKVYNSLENGINITQWKATCIPLKIVKPYIYNPCASLTSASFFANAIRLYEQTPTAKTENIEIIEPTIIDNRATKKTKNPIYVENSLGVNISFIDPIKITSLLPYPTVLSASGDYRFELSDKNKQMKLNITGWEISLSADGGTIATHITNDGSTALALGRVNNSFPKNTPITFEVTNAFGLAVAANTGNIILGYTSTTQFLKSFMVGASVTVLRKGNDLIVTNMVGTWTTGTQ